MRCVGVAYMQYDHSLLLKDTLVFELIYHSRCRQQLLLFDFLEWSLELYRCIYIQEGWIDSDEVALVS